VNVDYSVCNGLNFNSDGLSERLVIYDVMCQYFVNFEERVRDVSDHLWLDPDVKLFGAVGKFHLSDHVDSCFCQWTLNFMKGSGHIDGEIMETLWSGMNKVSGAARSMSKAHRQETLDDYMRDSNWKKTVGIGKFFFSPSRWFLIIIFFSLVSTLLIKLKRSQVGLDSTEPAFDQLTNSCLQRKLPVKVWKSSEHLAMEERGEHLKIFDINQKKAPTLAEITLSLINTKGNSNNIENVVDWIANGIKAQNDQWVLILFPN
jgi:Kyakuja-Dileera-Zisupton transposase